MISNKNKYVQVLSDKECIAYYKKICDIFNNIYEKQKYFNKVGLHKISLSELYNMAMTRFILMLDSELDYSSKNADIVHQQIFEFIKKRM